MIADVETAVDNSPLFRTYRVKIVRGWKRRMIGRTTIRSERTDCMADLTTGGRYLLYLRRTPAGFVTEACAGNIPVERAATAVAALRRLYR